MVYEWDEYGVRAALPSMDIVLDIGAHIGCFTQLAIDAGVPKILSVEMWSANYRQLEENCGGAAGVQLIHACVVGAPEDTPAELCGRFAGADWGGRIGITEIFERVAAKAGARVLLKLDVEGWEYPILESLRKRQLLQRMTAVVGEYHGWPWAPFLITEYGHVFSFFSSLPGRWWIESGDNVRSEPGILGYFRIGDL